jgi:hypothetical protein
VVVLNVPTFVANHVFELGRCEMVDQHPVEHDVGVVGGAERMRIERADLWRDVDRRHGDLQLSRALDRGVVDLGELLVGHLDRATEDLTTRHVFPQADRGLDGQTHGRDPPERGQHFLVARIRISCTSMGARLVSAAALTNIGGEVELDLRHGSSSCSASCVEACVA